MLASALAYCALSMLAGLLIGLGVRPPQLPPAVRPLPPEGFPTRSVLLDERDALRRELAKRDEVIRDLRLEAMQRDEARALKVVRS